MSRLKYWLQDRRTDSTRLIYLGRVKAYLIWRDLPVPPAFKIQAARYSMQRRRTPRVIGTQPLTAHTVEQMLASPRYKSAAELFKSLEAGGIQHLSVADSLKLRDALLADIILLNAPR